MTAQTPTRRQVFGLAAGAAALVALPGLARAESSGTFTGLSNHVTTGGVTVARDGERFVIRLHEDFSLDGAPDAVVGLGHEGRYDARTFAGELRSLTGAQDYVLPAAVNADAFGEVYIYCRRFDVPLGVAPLR